MPKDASHHVHQQEEKEEAQDEEGPPAVAGVDARKTDLLRVGCGWEGEKGREVCVSCLRAKVQLD